jgi:hypothetical protein
MINMQLTIMDVVGAITTTLHYILYPVILLAKSLISVACFLLIPFLHLGRAILYVFLVPVRILGKFEVRTVKQIILQHTSLALERSLNAYLLSPNKYTFFPVNRN